MKTWKVTEATMEHVRNIALNMREADKREVWASHRHTPEEALENSLKHSGLAWTCFIHGQPAFMWGVARAGSLLSETGAPWLLGTEAVYEIRKDFLKQSRRYVEIMQERFSRLENYVHAENRLSIRWLQWCGFTVEQNAIERNRESFFLFWRGR